MSLNFIPVYLLKKSLTTPEDLRKIANSLNFNIDYIGFGYNFPEIKDSSKLCILNLGNDLIGGTHWLAVNNESKEFFDPIGAPPPNYIPKDYKNNIQESLYYMNHSFFGMNKIRLFANKKIKC
mgnify:CR=1 FL=1